MRVYANCKTIYTVFGVDVEIEIEDFVAHAI